MKLEILYEDAYLLACVKPYGVLSQGDKGNDEDMITKSSITCMTKRNRSRRKSRM